MRWWQDDYYKYRIQDSFYADSGFTILVYTGIQQEFYVYNRAPMPE